MCVIDIFSKYARVIPLKDKKGITAIDAFQKILDDSDRRPNKIWLYKGSEFYMILMENNDIEMYSIDNEAWGEGVF